MTLEEKVEDLWWRLDVVEKAIGELQDCAKRMKDICGNLDQRIETTATYLDRWR